MFMEDYYFNQIANDYHLKRKEAWKPLEEFMSFLKERNYNLKGIS